jgi:broad specificity phosphatase PhoE
MSELQPRHIVIVRHGESVGDVRREARKAGRDYPTPANTATEPQTERGHRQSVLAGKWITKYVLEAYRITQFDLQLTSPTVRTKQSAESLGMRGKWLDEPLLTERNRGKIQGLPKKAHTELYPESYREMIDDPLHWMPPGGESILSVAERAGQLRDRIASHACVLLETHRDWIWAANMTWDGVTEQDLLAINTDLIRNAQILHYTNVNPSDGTIAETHLWKRSVCPWATEAEIADASQSWTKLDQLNDFIDA